MSTFYSGQNGRMLIGTETAAKVTNWSINSTQSPLNCTTLEQEDQTYINGLRSTTGTCRLFYYDYTVGNTAKNDAKTLINSIMKARATSGDAGNAPVPNSVTLELQIVDGTATPKVVKVEALITSASMAMAVGEVLAADIAFQVNGAPITVTI
jgi:hypothetical protein